MLSSAKVLLLSIQFQLALLDRKMGWLSLSTSFLVVFFVLGHLHLSFPVMRIDRKQLFVLVIVVSNLPRRHAMDVSFFLPYVSLLVTMMDRPRSDYHRPALHEDDQERSRSFYLNGNTTIIYDL